MSEAENKELPFGYAPVKGIDQGHLIPMINLYLQNETKLNLRANNNGICNGLAAVYCKYKLEGRQAEFIKIIQAINKKGQDLTLLAQNKLAEISAEAESEITDSQISKFIGEVLLAFLPQEYDKKFSQDDATGFLRVSSALPNTETGLTNVHIDKPLKKVFNLGLITSPAKWGEIFDTMKAPDTAWTVATLRHTIAVSVEDNQFHVYDSNNNKIQVCNTGAELAQLFSENIFSDFNDKALTTMPLTINVMAHPDKQNSFQFPDKNSLLVNDPQLVHQILNENGLDFDSLSMAALQNDVKMIKHLFSNGADYSNMALKIAVRDNRLDAMAILLHEDYRHHVKGDKESTYYDLCRIALNNGRIEAFEKLLKDPEIANIFIQSVADPVTQKLTQIWLLESVASSANPKCVEKLISLLEEHSPKANIPDLIKSGKVLKNAEKSDNKQCIELLKNAAGISVAPNIKEQSPIQKNSAEDKTSIKFIESLTSFSDFFKKKYDQLKTLVSNALSKNTQKNFKTSLEDLRNKEQESPKDENESNCAPSA